MTTLNDTFEKEFTQENEGYESGSKSLSILTLLRRAPWIYHISMGTNYLWTLPHHLLQLNNTQYTHTEASEATALYATIWCLTALMMRAL